MFATGIVIGVKPATEYQFRILVTPVGPYFKGGDTAITITVADFDRAAPRGTGDIKAGLNYAMSLHPYEEAHANGYSENLYLDSRSRTYVEETGGTNVLFVDKKGGLVVPVSATDSILPSITRRSLVELAKHLGIAVEERPVRFDEVVAGDFAECGCIGTAAVISHVAKVEAEGVDVTFPDCGEAGGPVLTRLREALVAIQTCKAEDPFGWVVKIV
jgi:branched-chain amino acid aminotransferase